MTTTDHSPKPEAVPGLATGWQRGVVVGVDGSPAGVVAALWAAEEAQRLGSPLTLLRAVHMPDSLTAPLLPADHAQHRLAQGSDQLSQEAEYTRSRYRDLQVTTELSRLSPTHVLVAASRKSSLIVTGTRGHGGFAGMRVGSVARALAAHTLCLT